MSTPAWGEEVARRLGALKKQQEEEEGEEEYIPEDEDEGSDDGSEYEEEESNSGGSGNGGRRASGRRAAAAAGGRANRGGGAGRVYVAEGEESEWMMGPDGVRRRRKQLTQKWTQAEDLLLAELVFMHGERDWGLVASHMPGSHRKGKQCRERWRNQLDPNIKRYI